MRYSQPDIKCEYFSPFAHSHGGQRKQAQPLQNPLTYVVFENVDIARPNDANYDSIAALCKVLLETDYYNTTPCRAQYVQLLEQSRWMGYVRLRLREPTPAQQRSSSRAAKGADQDRIEEGEEDDNDYGIYTDGSSGYSTAGAGTINSCKSASSSDRGSWAEEGDYDHVYIARLNTQRTVQELKMLPGNLQRNVLPEACICRLASCLPAWAEHSEDEDEDEEDEEEEDDEKEDDDQADVYTQENTRQAQLAGYETVQVLRQCRVEQQRRRALLQQCYLSSERFMHYFGELLREQLAHELGISQRQFEAGSYRGCSIYTATDELVPAIHVPHGWPDCAFEFNLRARPQWTDPQTGEKFTWPTAVMRKRIQSFGFHVVPVGYAPKRARNPFRQLEWRIVFPQAEQYLERQLTHVQLKLLLLMKSLVRTFVNDKCQAMGHIMEQLRTHLFWECERNCVSDWTEEFLGDRLVRFVRSFADCLARKQLNDYFIERRNLFEHVPEDALMELRSIMAGIGEQPLLHVLQALRNLQHAPDFYPQLNYGQLLETLITQEYQQLRNGSKFARKPLPVAAEQIEPMQEQQRSATLSTANPSDAVGLLGMWRQQERPRGKLRRKTQMLRAQQQQQLKQDALRRHSADSISGWPMPLLLPRASQASSGSASSTATLTAPPALNNSVEILRRTNLLEQLMDHMLAMLAKATEFRNAQYAQLYLEQTQLLCRLYKQLGCDQHAQHYADALCQAASNLERSVAIDGSVQTGSGHNSPGSRSRSSTNSRSRYSPMRRKSLKFVEHVVQMHSGAVTPLQGTSSPLARQQTAEHRSENLDEIQVLGNADETPPTDAKESVPILESLLQRMQVDPAALQAISSKTEQLMQTLAPEAKREELRNMLKRNTQKLKSAFS